MLEPEHTVVGGVEYCIGRLDLFQALDAARLAGPSLPALFSGVIEGIVRMCAEDKNMPAPEQIATALAASQPLLERIAAMPQKDFKTLVSTCLSCVERKTPAGKFAPVLVEGIPYSDFPAADALVLTLHVLVREIRPIGAALFALGSEKA